MSLVVFNEDKGPSKRGLMAARDFAMNEVIQIFKPDFVSTGRPILSSRLTSLEVLVFQIYLETRKNPDLNRDLDYYTTHYNVMQNEPLVDEMTRNVLKLVRSPQNEIVVRKICCLVLINGLNISAIDPDAKGEALCFGYAMLNHACLPNTYTIPMGDGFALISNRPIKKDTEITTNYCFGSFPTFIRKYTLLRQFHFTCRCNLCANRKEWFFSYSCPRCKSHLMNVRLYTLFHTKFVRHKCQLCGKAIDSAALQAVQRQHRFLILNLLYDSQHPTNSDFKLESIQKEIMHLSPECLENYVAKETFGYIPDCTESKIKRIKNVVFWLLSTGFVPAYCYPLDIYISRITLSKIDFFAWQDQLQLYLADALLLAIPQIICPYKHITYDQMKYLAIRLLMVRAQVEGNPEIKKSLVVSSYNLIRQCLLYVNVEMVARQKMEDESLFDLLKITQNVIERSGLQDEDFHEHFHKLLAFSGISLRYNKKKFMVQYANRTYGALF